MSLNLINNFVSFEIMKCELGSSHAIDKLKDLLSIIFDLTWIFTILRSLCLRCHISLCIDFLAFPARLEGIHELLNLGLNIPSALCLLYLSPLGAAFFALCISKLHQLCLEDSILSFGHLTLNIADTITDNFLSTFLLVLLLFLSFLINTLLFDFLRNLLLSDLQTFSNYCKTLQMLLLSATLVLGIEILGILLS